MGAKNCNICSWNPRGLNSGARQDAVCALVRDAAATIVCLQETKLDFIDTTIVVRTLGHSFVDSFAYLLAVGTRGGILLTCSADHFTLIDVALTENTISATITSRDDATSWSIMGVYGSQGDAEKRAFLQEIRLIANSMPP
ncbi:hypothetical protein BRADI_3g25768v3, partial [Brachypodium distachyon]